MKKVDDSHFLDFCLTAVRKRKTMFTEVPIGKVMKWSASPIDKPLTHIPATLETQVKALTILIYQFGGELHMKHPRQLSEMCEDILRSVFGKTDLIDEAYLLTLK